MAVTRSPIGVAQQLLTAMSQSSFTDLQWMPVDCPAAIVYKCMQQSRDNNYILSTLLQIYKQL